MNRNGIIGHTHQLRKLELMLSREMIPQALLFSGLSGIGKKLIAERFLSSLFCSAPEPPCLNCHTCIQIQHGTYPDLIEIGPDEKGKIPIGSADKKEEGSVRWLIERLTKRSLSGKYGIIIDGVEKISIPGQNALLKTIEEPQIGSHIILLASNKSQILPTIISRCSDITFYPLSVQEIKTILNDKSFDMDINLVSEISGGSVATALLLSDKEILDDILEICREISNYLNDGASLLLDMNTIQKKIGVENIIDILINIYRNILLISINNIVPVQLLKDLIVKDMKKLTKLIKILLALKKGLSNNLNIRNSLKGLLYSIHTIDDIGVPQLDRVYI